MVIVRVALLFILNLKPANPPGLKAALEFGPYSSNKEKGPSLRMPAQETMPDVTKAPPPVG